MLPDALETSLIRCVWSDESDESDAWLQSYVIHSD